MPDGRADTSARECVLKRRLGLTQDGGGGRVQRRLEQEPRGCAGPSPLPAEEVGSLYSSPAQAPRGGGGVWSGASARTSPGSDQRKKALLCF